MKIQELFEFILFEKELSIPKLQKKFDCGYSKAKEIFNECLDNKWAVFNSDNATWEINDRTLNRRKLTENECEVLAEQITDREMKILERASGLDYEGCTGFQAEESLSDEIANLISLNVIHFFSDSYFLSIDQDSVLEIKKHSLDIPDDFWISEIAVPIIFACIECPEHGNQLLDSAYITKDCKEYVRCNIERFRKRNLKHKKSNGKLGKTVKFDIIEELIATYEFSTKEEYESVAKMNCDIIINSKFMCDSFKKIVKEATDEIVKELTIENILEIRKLLNS